MKALTYRARPRMTPCRRFNLFDRCVIMPRSANQSYFR